MELDLVANLVTADLAMPLISVRTMANGGEWSTGVISVISGINLAQTEGGEALKYASK